MLCIISSNRTADSDDAAAVVKITLTLSSSDFHCIPQLQGRISGDAEWKAQRGEDGKSLADLEASTDSMCGVEIINETADSDGREGDRVKVILTTEAASSESAVGFEDIIHNNHEGKWS